MKRKKRDKESTELVAEPKAGRYAKATQEDSAGFADSMSDAFKQSNEKKYFMLLIVAAVITPPDVTSQVLVAIPLMILFYASIILCKILFRRKLAEQEEDLD